MPCEASALNLRLAGNGRLVYAFASAVAEWGWDAASGIFCLECGWSWFREGGRVPCGAGQGKKQINTAANTIFLSGPLFLVSNNDKI